MKALLRNGLLFGVTVSMALLNARQARAADATGHCAPGWHELCITNGGGGYCPGNPGGACYDAYITTWQCNMLLSGWGPTCETGSGECDWVATCQLRSP